MRVDAVAMSQAVAGRVRRLKPPPFSKPHTPSHTHRDRTPGEAPERSHPNHTHHSPVPHPANNGQRTAGRNHGRNTASQRREPPPSPIQERPPRGDSVHILYPGAPPPIPWSQWQGRWPRQHHSRAPVVTGDRESR